jgi:hypothetical protein
VILANIRLLLSETYLLSNFVNVWILDVKSLGVRGEHALSFVQSGKGVLSKEDSMNPHIVFVSEIF